MAEIVGSLRTTVHGSFYREDMNHLVNLHLVGSSNVGYYNKDTGKIELIDHPNIKLVKEAHSRICQNFALTIEADMYSDGTVDNFRIAQRKR